MIETIGVLTIIAIAVISWGYIFWHVDPQKEYDWREEYRRSEQGEQPDTFEELP